MIWIIALIVGVVLLIVTHNVERATGESKTLARYGSLFIIGFSVGALLTPYLGG